MAMMDGTAVDERYQTIAWGALLILFGSLGLVPGNQSGLFVLGTGIILLGLNLARYSAGIPANAVTTTLGALAAGLGLLALFGPALNLPPFELPLFPLVLVAIGITLVGRATRPAESA
jgi:hypothetical protein